MKRKYYNKVMSVLISTGIIASLGGYSNQLYANQDDTINKAIQSIEKQNLTNKLNTLQIEGIQQLDPLIDTKSEKEISIIVQLKGNVNKESKEKIKNTQEKFEKFIKDKNANKKDKKDKEIKIKEKYSKVFNGMSMSINSSEVESLLESDEVQSVWLDQEVQIDPIINNNTQNNSDKKEATNVDSVNQIEADKLHEKNITGKGVKVGVLDTGIDYNHPDLKDNFKGGYDCVDEDNDPMEATYEDWKNSGEAEFQGVNSYYTEHGTHVSGSIAGSGKSDLQHSVKGVAFEADLYGYRVLGPYGSGYTSDILQGIEIAVTEGMDVINLSLGSGENNPYSPLSQGVNNAMLQGTTVVIAAGTLGSPGASSFPITVGASSTYITRTKYDIKIGEEKVDLVSIAKGFDDNMDKLENNEYEVVFVDGGEDYEYTNQGLDKEDIEGKVVLYRYIGD